MNTKTRFFAISTCVITLLFLIAPQLTVAQNGVDDPNGPFQLEGNATKDSSICLAITVNGALLATPGGGGTCPTGYNLVTFGASSDDWENVLAKLYSGTAQANSAVAASYVADTFNSSNDASFFSGGSKDTLGISTGPWEWQNTSNQGKADIEHAYAAAYSTASGHTYIYFGMDRYDNSGDTTGGFWFFQDSTVALSQTKKGGGFLISGHHTNGDLLIVADYATGGATPSISTYTWNCSGSGATCDSTGTLVAQTSAQANAAQCDPTKGVEPLCAITNGTNNLTAPWGFSEKHGSTSFQAGEFMEGGVDLQSIFGNNVPCFTTFMAETRASTSPTSSLADLTPPVSFPLCGISVTKSCNGNGVVTNNGSTITYTWTVTATNNGIGSLYDVTVLDTLPDGVTVPVTLVSESTTPNFLGAKLSTSATVTFVLNCSGGICTGAETGGKTVANPLSVTNTADVQAYTAPGSGGSKITPSPDVPQTSSCQASAPGAISVTKHCDPTFGGPVLESNASGTNVIVKVPFTADVCASTTSCTGNPPVCTTTNSTEGIQTITMSDVPGATFTQNGTISSLNPGQCAVVKGYYYPTAVDSVGTGQTPGLIAGRYFFTDTLTATGKGTISGDALTNSGAVSCPICPNGECDGSLP